MRRVVYTISREIVVLLSIFLFIKLNMEGELFRAITSVISSVLFIICSKIYEKKYNLITISYIYFFMVIYGVFTFSAALCSKNQIKMLNRSGLYGHWTKDYYSIYFIVTTITYIIILFYLKYTKFKNSDRRIVVKKIMSDEYNWIVFGTLIMIIGYFITRSYELLIPSLCSLVVLGVMEKRKSAIIIACVVAITNRALLTQRYKFVAVALSILLIWLYVTKFNMIEFSLIKSNIIAVLGAVVVCIYGVISEIVKLNTGWNANYSIKTVFTSSSTLSYFVNHQLYRIFTIWIKLGGYIIGHVQKNGYYYGATYIKFLSGIFGFEYVSLPQISAVYDNATYAQPGLVAEGYANFGIIGAVLNIVIIFFLMEYLTRKFINNPTHFNMLLASVPFGQIIFDGGTLNSAIYLIFVCILMDLFRIMIMKVSLKFTIQ